MIFYLLQNIISSLTGIVYEFRSSFVRGLEEKLKKKRK